METKLKVYKKHHKEDYEIIIKAFDVIQSLINRNFESYLIGSCVHDLYLDRPLDGCVEIATLAKPEELKQLFPSLKYAQTEYYIMIDNIRCIFTSFPSNDVILPKKYSEAYFNKKLTYVLLNRAFTFDALAISPNKQLIDLFNGKEDLDNESIKIIDGQKSVFETHPELILKSLVKASRLNFLFDKKTLKQLAKASNNLKNIEYKYVVKAIREMTMISNRFLLYKSIYKSSIFSFDKKLDYYLKLVTDILLDLTPVEKATLLYLIIGEIPDACFHSKNDLSDITENMTITNLICQTKITPMMIYNIGKQKLLDCDEIARTYKKKYHPQASLIKRLAKRQVIKSSRDLDFTSLELIMMLNGERSIKIKIIMNLLLEKVINKEIPNQNHVIKEEAKKLITKISDIYDYDDSSTPSSYTDEELNNLHQKYLKEFDFLVKVYLNDEKELYSLTALEREEAVQEAKEHARKFLTETSQYKILIERALI